MKLGTDRKLKFRKLKMRLRLAHWEVVGLLQSIWGFVAENCPQGDIGKFDDDDIAAMIEWMGDPAELINAMVDCGWLDRSEKYRLVVHDWHEHAPKYLKANLASRGLTFAKASEPLEDPSEPLEDPSEPLEDPSDVLTAPSEPPSSQVKSSQVKSSQVYSGQAKSSLLLDQKFLTAWTDETQEIIRAVGTPLDKDHTILAQIAYALLTRDGIGRQVRDSINSIRGVETRPRAPCAYLRKCLNESLGKAGVEEIIESGPTRRECVVVFDLIKKSEEVGVLDLAATIAKRRKEAM